jgi:outer membrane protein OmpA-like peptidoglycan-associated protein
VPRIFMSSQFFQKNFLAVLFVTSCFLPASAQTVAQLMKEGDKNFAEADFYAASQYYKDALKKDDENILLNYKYAESCRTFNDMEGAEKGYRQVIKLDKSNQFPMAIFWLAEVLRSNCECKCDEAVKWLHKFQIKYHKKDFYNAKAQQEIEACAWVRDHSKKNDSIKVEHLGNDINTPQSEFNAIHVFPDKIQFSSLRNISTDKKSEKYLVRIYNQLPNPEPIFVPNGANAQLNIGNGTYSPDSKKFFFTQCEPRDKTTSRCDIYVTKYENYKWATAEKLSEHVNDPKATNTQPCVGYDLSGNEILLFSSDREGGEGGMDIWISKLNTDGSYQPAVNAGNSINSKGNEVTPFYDINNKKLFFSSDWHYGFGGYDIFETAGESTNWTSPKNLLQPINTPQNDLYYSVAFDNSKAYITSNRKGSLFVEAETCCNDIYAYATGKKIEKKKEISAEVKTETVLLSDTAIAVKEEAKQIFPVDTMPATKFINEQLRKVKQLLPVTLYFHNDEPGAKTLSDTTALDYKKTYEAYTVLLNEYEKEFSKGLRTGEKTMAEKEVFELFAKKVDKGYYDLVAFSSQLLDLLNAGNKIEITIKGFCSPLNFNAYNIHLGYRRISSLRNYFYHYREGLLNKFISNGNLLLKNESLGEETAPKNISDNREDTRNSVYNPAAALERRVEIVSVELK